MLTDHLCDTPGCGTVLVLDGNMKNCRQVCACRDIGELKFDGLQGTVVVGVYIIFTLHVCFTKLFSYHYVVILYCLAKFVNLVAIFGWHCFYS